MYARRVSCRSARHAGMVALAGLVLLGIVGTAFADKVEDEFNFATGLFIEGDYELAAGEYETFLKAHADHALAARAQFQLGESFMRLEQYGKAVAPLSAYAARKTTDPDRLAAALFRLGKAHTELGKPAEAAKSYQAFLDKFPQHKLASAARYWVGECLLRADKPKEASKALELALQTDKGGRYEPYCVYRLGAALFSLEQYEPASKRFADVLARFPKEEFASDAALKLAQCLESLGRQDEAAKAYEHAEKTFGGKVSVEARMGRAALLYRKGELDQAYALFAAVAREHPKHEMADLARYNAGSALFNLGRFKDALPHFDALAQGKGKHAVPSLYWKGMCLLGLDKPGDALGPLKQVADAKGPYQARGKFAVGDAHYDAGKFKESQQSYEDVARNFPKDELADDALHAAAAAASKRGAHAEAAALADELARKHPQSPFAGKARLLVAEVLFQQEKFAEAEKVFAELAKNLPEGVGKDAVTYKLAWCASKQGRAKEASDLFRRVADENKDSKLAAESLYMAAKLLADTGKHADAKALYERCLKEHPDSPTAEKAAYAVAVADFSQRQWDKAAAGLRAFAQRYPNSKLVPDAMFYLGESHFAAGQYDAARAAYDEVTAKHPKSAVADKALYGSAWCLREKKAFKEACVAFEKVAATFPTSAVCAQALYWAGRCRMDLAEHAQARGLFARTLQAPGAEKVAADAAYHAARCLLSEKKHDEAVKALEKFLKDHAKSERRVNALYDLAWAYRGKGDEAKARQYFQQVAQQNQDALLKADALFRLAEGEYDKEKFKQAAARYEQIADIKGVTFLPEVYYKLGWCREKMGQTKEALAAYRAVAEKHAESDLAPDAAFRIGRVLQQLGEHAKAAEQFAALLKRPDLDKKLAARARFQYAETLRAQERWGDAVRVYRELTQAGSGFEPVYHAHYGLGVCALQLNALEDARKAFSTVIEQTETETAARAQLALGEILCRQAKFDEAAREFLKVNILYGYPKWKAEGLLQAAKAFSEAEQKDRAQRYLKKLIEDFPQSEQATEAKKLLEGMK